MSGSAFGICIGSSASCVVVAEQGGIETFFNEFDDRITPTCVSFNGKMRYIGYAAKQQPIKDVRNRLCAFTRFMGKTFNDGMNEIKARKYIGCDIYTTNSVNQQPKQDVEHRVRFRVEYCGKERILYVEQVYAMQLTKLKEIAEIKLGKNVADVVINVPTNATDSHRRAIFDAAKIANVNGVNIINDTTATALAYAFYQQNSSVIYYKERIVVFVDMGYSHLQSSIVSFRDGEIRVIASSCDDIGGYDFDRAIYDHIKTEFDEMHKEKVKDNPKMAVRLMEECEKLKKSMNASVASIPLNIDCFTGDVDLSTTMQRSKFEELCKGILSRVRMTLERLRDDDRVRLEDIDDVEIVGGSTRLSAIKQIINEVFHKEPRVSLNAEEAVARGCAVQAAIISRVEQFKEIKIVDLYPHKIVLSCIDDHNNNIGKLYSFPSMIHTFDCSKSLQVEVKNSYCDNDNVCIALFNVHHPGEANKAKGELSLDAYGLFTLCLTITDCKIDKNIINNYMGNDTLGNKEVTIIIRKDLSIETTILQEFSSHIERFKEEEKQFIEQSYNEGVRVCAKNLVQEYVIKMRDAYCARDAIRGQLCALLGEAEEMCKSEERVTSEHYFNILKYLKNKSDDIIKKENEIGNKQMYLTVSTVDHNDVQLKPCENEREFRTMKNLLLECVEKLWIQCRVIDANQREFDVLLNNAEIYKNQCNDITKEGYINYRENLKNKYENILYGIKLQLKHGLNECGDNDYQHLMASWNEEESFHEDINQPRGEIQQIFSDTNDGGDEKQQLNQGRDSTQLISFHDLLSQYRDNILKIIKKLIGDSVI